jgi:hypothetical protein
LPPVISRSDFRQWLFYEIERGWFIELMLWLTVFPLSGDADFQISRGYRQFLEYMDSIKVSKLFMVLNRAILLSSKPRSSFRRMAESRNSTHLQDAHFCWHDAVLHSESLRLDCGR